MTWFKVDDSLPDHPKTVALEESKHFGPAMGLWAVAGSWCAKHLTDGAVPKRLIRKLGFRDAHAAALVAVGFWDTITDGYQFHNWLKWQPSRLSVTAKREATAARVQRHRNSSGAGGSNGTGSAPCNAVTNAVSNAPIDPGPSRPDPTREANASTPQSPQGGQRVRLEFAKRFKAARKLPWAMAKHHRSADELAAWLQQAEGVSLAQLLDGFFGDEWAQGAGYPFAALAKSPEKYAVPPSRPDPEAKAKARAAQIARIDAEILGGSR